MADGQVGRAVQRHPATAGGLDVARGPGRDRGGRRDGRDDRRAGVLQPAADRDRVGLVVRAQRERAGQEDRVGEPLDQAPRGTAFHGHQGRAVQLGGGHLVHDRQRRVAEPVGEQHRLVALEQHRADAAVLHQRAERRRGRAKPTAAGTTTMTGRSGEAVAAACSGTGGPTATPSPAVVEASAHRIRTRPSALGGSAMAVLVVTGRSGAAAASVARSPQDLSSRRSSAAAASSEAAEPFGPRAGSRSAPSTVSPPPGPARASTASVVELPMSSPATTVTS